jgi:predicted RNA-binding protein with PUA-like domain
MDQSMAYWLFKSEPQLFSIDHLAASPQATAAWDGVRNYQARNSLRDEVKKGDIILFYHSSCPNPGIVGLAEVAREAYPDPSAWDPGSPAYDPKSLPQKPTWYMVDVRYLKHLPSMVSLSQIKDCPQLSGMGVTRKGNRLSIQPVEPSHYEQILQMAAAPLESIGQPAR